MVRYASILAKKYGTLVRYAFFVMVRAWYSSKIELKYGTVHGARYILRKFWSTEVPSLATTQTKQSSDLQAQTENNLCLNFEAKPNDLVFYVCCYMFLNPFITFTNTRLRMLQVWCHSIEPAKKLPRENWNGQIWFITVSVLYSLPSTNSHYKSY